MKRYYITRLELRRKIWKAYVFFEASNVKEAEEKFINIIDGKKDRKLMTEGGHNPILET